MSIKVQKHSSAHNLMKLDQSFQKVRMIHTTQLHIPDLERQFCIFERPMTLN